MFTKIQKEILDLLEKEYTQVELAGRSAMTQAGLGAPRQLSRGTKRIKGLIMTAFSSVDIPTHVKVSVVVKILTFIDFFLEIDPEGALKSLKEDLQSNKQKRNEKNN